MKHETAPKDFRRRAGAASQFLRSLANRHRLMILCSARSRASAPPASSAAASASGRPISRSTSRSCGRKRLVATRRVRTVIYYRLASERVSRSSASSIASSARKAESKGWPWRISRPFRRARRRAYRARGGALWLANGRIAGISGIVGGMRAAARRRAWRVAFVIGMLAAAGLYGIGRGRAARSSHRRARSPRRHGRPSRRVRHAARRRMHERTRRLRYRAAFRRARSPRRLPSWPRGSPRSSSSVISWEFERHGAHLVASLTASSSARAGRLADDRSRQGPRLSRSAGRLGCEPRLRDGGGRARSPASDFAWPAAGRPYSRPLLQPRAPTRSISPCRGRPPVRRRLGPRRAIALALRSPPLPRHASSRSSSSRRCSPVWRLIAA